MLEECKGDKFEFLAKVKQLAHETRQRVETRLLFEDRIMDIWQNSRTLEEEKEVWIDYIKFEIS